MEVIRDATSPDGPIADVGDASDLDEMALKDHPVRLVVAFVEALDREDREDWVEMGVDINVGRTGASAYHPWHC